MTTTLHPSEMQIPSHSPADADRAQDDLVRTLHDGYDQGLSRTDDPAEQAKKAWWSSLQSYSKSRLTGAEQRIAATCKHYCTRAVRAAHHLDVNTCCQLLGLARERSDNVGLGEEARLLCKSEVAAAESHLDFALGDFDQARARMLEAIVLDQDLEDHFGYKLLHVHRIHIVGRLIKLEARTSHMAQSMALAAQALSYLHGGTEMLPVEGAWGRQYLNHLSTGVLQFLTRQITIEVAAALLNKESGVIRDSVLPVVDSPGFRSTQSHWDPVSHEWLVLKLLSTQAEQVPHYLTRCAAFLAQGPGKVPLWYLTALDAATICRGVQSRHAELFRKEVLKDLTAVDFLPLSFKKSWSKFLAQP